MGSLFSQQNLDSIPLLTSTSKRFRYELKDGGTVFKAGKWTTSDGRAYKMGMTFKDKHYEQYKNCSIVVVADR
jgi:hypothetical protein